MKCKPIQNPTLIVATRFAQLSLLHHQLLSSTMYNSGQILGQVSPRTRYILAGFLSHNKSAALCMGSVFRALPLCTLFMNNQGLFNQCLQWVFKQCATSCYYKLCYKDPKYVLCIKPRCMCEWDRFLEHSRTPTFR